MDLLLSKFFFVIFENYIVTFYLLAVPNVESMFDSLFISARHADSDCEAGWIISSYIGDGLCQ